MEGKKKHGIRKPDGSLTQKELKRRRMEYFDMKSDAPKPRGVDIELVEVRLLDFANDNGLSFNSENFERLVPWIAKNSNSIDVLTCPCSMVRTCPCDEALDMIEEKGECGCHLFIRPK